MLPSGWVKKKVGDLFEVQLGKMLNQLAKEQNPQYEYLGNSDIQWGKINTENLNTMFFSVREIQKFHLVCGDILMCEGGEVGRCAIWKNQKQDILYQKAIHRLRSKGNIIPEYFYGYMISIAGTKLLDDFTTKTSIAHLTQEKLLELPVIVPPLPEQKKIAQILSTWDKAINTTEQLITNSQQQKKALMQQLLTGKKRLLDDNGVRFGGEWEKFKLKEICVLGTGVSAPQDEKYFKNGEHDFLRVSDLGGSETRFAPASRDRINDEAIRDLKMTPVESGATLFTKSGASLLLNQRAQLKSDTFIVSHIGFAKALDKLANIDFLYYLFCTIDFKNLASGTSLPALQLAVLSSYPVKVPNITEQQKIASVLSSADREIELLQSKLTSLKQEKKALMQQLLTGKRRVLV